MLAVVKSPEASNTLMGQLTANEVCRTAAEGGIMHMDPQVLAVISPPHHSDWLAQIGVINLFNFLNVMVMIKF